MKHGAVDFLTKPVNGQALLRAVRAALALDASTRQARTEMADLEGRLASLTPREREVLSAVMRGKRNKQIADDLGIVEQTVKFHRARIMERMRVHTLAELMHVAIRLGVESQPGDASRT